MILAKVAKKASEEEKEDSSDDDGAKTKRGRKYIPECWTRVISM